MPSPATTVVLRKISIAAFAPGLILLLIHGIVASRPFPALGILPLAASALFSLLIIRRDFIAALGSPIQALSELNMLVGDVSLAVFHFIFVFISWTQLTRVWDEGQIVLGTYGTVPMMLVFGIHFSIALPQLFHVVIKRSCDCPHCRSVAKAGYFSSSTTEYTPLNDGDTEPEIVDRDIEEGVSGSH
ncbi:hypothetical protein CTRI78_v008743 [Colletotrichum trifolii]|uniref:Uncharacterized protein n=1 Tax=Colletotrichum trifolii TaxID=5466 RepID=A0A4R8QSI0_COLTR|nr:hypothetical protein CTRI78_v008743 [Colletotrichum trifolii]